MPNGGYKRLKEQVKRNISRFPESFRFQLSYHEKNELVANCDRFEAMKGERKSDLPERSFEFVKWIVLLCRTLDEKPGISRTLTNPLLRSGTAVGANIEEGQASQSEADFVSKYSIACKEARETHYWLRLLCATGIVEDSKLADLTDNVTS